MEELPAGCRLTIISDSCHSGGLIENTKEQIGESTKRDDDDDGDESGSVFSLSSFLKQTVKKKVKSAFQSRGIDGHRRHHHHHHDDDDDDEEEADDGEQSTVKNRSLPLSTLIEILQQKTGNENIDVGNIRPTLFDMFGEDASPKVKKFMKVILQKLHRRGSHGDGEGGQSGGLLGFVGGLAVQFMKHKLEENDEEEYAKPAMETRVYSKEEVYAGTKQGKLPHNGILISGCQSDQTSADANPTGSGEGAYGALSNAIQAILSQMDGGDMSNRKLVLGARKMLSRQGFKQRPGLYCNDDMVDEPFVC